LNRVSKNNGDKGLDKSHNKNNNNLNKNQDLNLDQNQNQINKSKNWKKGEESINNSDR